MSEHEDNSTDVTPSPAFLAREKRVMDAVALKTPDRVPVATVAHSFMTRCEGLTDAQSLYDYDRTREAYKASTKRFDFDMAPPIMTRFPGRVMDLLGLNTFKWPGGGLPDNMPYQFVESEYMKDDEYDAFLRDSGDFTIRTMWPRMAEVFAPLAHTPPLNWYTCGHMWSLIGNMAAMPPVQEMMKKMLAVGEEMQRYNAFQAQTVMELAAMGYPTVCTATVLVPFDWFSDYFRGLRATMFDMFRKKDQLKAAVDMLLPMQIQGAIMQARMSGNPRVFIPMHRGADTFMSSEQFEAFYWPGTKALFMALIDAGLTPMPWFEGSYNKRLKYLAELPPGKIMGHFDMIDHERFLDTCGNVMAMWGDVPAGLLNTGAPDETRDYVRKLIDTFAGRGHLIVDGAVEGIPAEAKVENVVAMMETVREHGQY